jgi:glycerol-3-phosphate dehydrogenase
MVGTTDVAYTGGMDHLHIDDSEINYLCHIINKRFNILLEKEDILTTWSGIRPLLSTTGKTPSTLSRDYLYEYSKNPAPVVTVYGGKITTYRRLAEHAVNELCDIFPHLTHSRTSFTPLPGAVFDTMSFAQYQTYAHNTYPWLDKEIRDRYLQTYGTRTEILLTGRKNVSDLGICFHPTLYQAEIDYLINEEWASSDEDILWRRTKLGLRLSDVERKTLRNYLCSRPSKQ